MLPGLPQRLVDAAQRRAAVAGDIAGRVQAGGAVARLLQHRQADQRLDPAHVDAAFVQGVLVVQAGAGQGVEQGVG
ncbi:hypothetical protein D3C72_1863130 [compost metagenome]